MKKCVYCGTIHEDDVEKCCEFSEFEDVEIEEKQEEKVEDPESKIDDQEFEEIVQPAAHELLVELVENINLDEVEEPKYTYPSWIEEIEYDDVKLQAKNRWFDEHPTLVQRIIKYLNL